MDCSLPGSSIHGIFQARVLEWGATKLLWYSSKCSSFNHEELFQSSFYNLLICTPLPVSTFLLSGAIQCSRYACISYAAVWPLESIISWIRPCSSYSTMIFINRYLVFRNTPNKVSLFPGLLNESVQFSCSVMSDSLGPHELQHTRPLCPSPAPGVHPDSHSSSQWCHQAISSSIFSFSSSPQSLPASESFPMSQFNLENINIFSVYRWMDS